MASANSKQHSVWVTGIGVISSVGEGVEAHAQGMASGERGKIDATTFAPYPVHVLPEMDWSKQISRRDMRQMEPWQQIGTYAAGLALEDAGAKENEELCSRMDMIVAAGGGERDVEVDSTLLAELRKTDNPDPVTAERLSNDLRPTLFLAQLSNLLAGNISIVHKVTGSSRTFMGEEGAGISAIQVATARIASGQSEIVLVGGGFNGERQDMQLLFELGHYMHKNDWASVRERTGAIAGSLGAFLVLESEEHARKRGQTPYAEIVSVGSNHGSAESGPRKARMKSLLEATTPNAQVGVLSAASGVASVVEDEMAVLAECQPSAPVRCYSNLTGFGCESQFPLGVALAAICLQRGTFPTPLEGAEAECNSAPDELLVSCLGFWRAEGVAHLRRIL